MLANYGDTPEKRRKSSCYEKFEISKNIYKIVTMWQIWATGNVFSKMTGKKMKNLSKKYTLLCKMLSFSSLFYILYSKLFENEKIYNHVLRNYTQQRLQLFNVLILFMSEIILHIDLKARRHDHVFSLVLKTELFLYDLNMSLRENCPNTDFPAPFFPYSD